jgi:hypothetical protein
MMFRFLGGLALTAVSLVLAWATLAKTADHQSTTPEPPAVASSEPVNPGRLMTASKILANAEWFDLIFRGTRAKARSQRRHPDWRGPSAPAARRCKAMRAEVSHGFSALSAPQPR